MLQELLEHNKDVSDELTRRKERGKSADDDPESEEEALARILARRPNLPKVVYEVTGDSGRIEPQLRLWIDPPSDSGGSSPLAVDEEEDSSAPLTETDLGEEGDGSHDSVGPIRAHMSLLWALQRQSWLVTAEEDRGKPVELPAAHIMEVPSDEYISLSKHCCHDNS